MSSARNSAYGGVVQLKAAALAIRALIVHRLDKKGQPQSIKVYMSTDTEQSATEVTKAYRYRYQQEFIFRDAKQFSGLLSGAGARLAQD